MIFSTYQIENSCLTLGCEFITRKPQQRGRLVDYSIGQVGVVTQDTPGRATIDVAKFKFRGNDQWERLDDEALCRVRSLQVGRQADPLQSSNSNP